MPPGVPPSARGFCCSHWLLLKCCSTWKCRACGGCQHKMLLPRSRSRTGGSERQVPLGCRWGASREGWKSLESGFLSKGKKESPRETEFFWLYQFQRPAPPHQRGETLRRGSRSELRVPAGRKLVGTMETHLSFCGWGLSGPSLVACYVQGFL